MTFSTAWTSSWPACDAVGVRSSCGIETRTFFPASSHAKPALPAGRAVALTLALALPPAQRRLQPMLDALRASSRRRNLDILERVNAHLHPVRVDYDRDVLPLTPAGSATERHMVEATIHAVEMGASILPPSGPIASTWRAAGREDDGFARCLPQHRAHEADEGGVVRPAHQRLLPGHAGCDGPIRVRRRAALLARSTAPRRRAGHLEIRIR